MTHFQLKSYWNLFVCCFFYLDGTKFCYLDKKKFKNQIIRICYQVAPLPLLRLYTIPQDSMAFASAFGKNKTKLPFFHLHLTFDCRTVFFRLTYMVLNIPQNVC